MSALAFAAAAFGQSGQSGGNISPGKISPAAVDVVNLALAGEMAAYGRDNQSPLSLSAAAEIIASIGVKEQALEKATEGGEADGAETPSPAAAEETDARALFAEAAAMAKEQNNYALAELIEKQAKASVGARQRIGGALKHTDTVKANGADIYTMKFNGQESAVVMANSPDGTDIDLEIYDQTGDLVARDNAFNNRPMVTWTPRWTGPFKVRIKNNTDRSVKYVLTTS
jgi:hypothetical protein